MRKAIITGISAAGLLLSAVALPAWADCDYKYVTASALNVRADPNANADRVGAYEYGERVCAYGIIRGWAKTPDGFVFARYLSDTRPPARPGAAPPARRPKK